MANIVLPNTFQKPNLYADRLAYYLTPAENVVLDKLVREILGFQHRIATRRARVSLSIFIDCKVVEGKTVALGCGLGLGAVRNALEGLQEYKVIKAVGGPTFEGQLWEIEIDADNIDWEGLEERKEKRGQTAQNRTRKATKASLKSRGHNTDIHCKDRVLERDKGLCRYCGEEATQLDHILPQSRGGETTLANCVAACFSCNSTKRDNTPEEAGMTLLPIGTTRQIVTSDVSLTSDVTPNEPRQANKHETLTGQTTDVNKETHETQKETQVDSVSPSQAPSPQPPALDGQQRAVDSASGGTAIDPVEEVAKHLRWLCAGPGVPLPSSAAGKKPYLKAARALLEKTDPADWSGVCYATDDWSETPPKEDEWRRDRTKEPGFSLDHIAAHYWAIRNRPEAEEFVLITRDAAPRDPLPAHEATWRRALPLLTAYKVKLTGARAQAQTNGTFVVSSPDAAFLAERLAGPVLEALRQVDGGIQAVEFVATGGPGGG